MILVQVSIVFGQGSTHWDYKQEFNKLNHQYNVGDQAKALEGYFQLFSKYDTGRFKDVYNTISKALTHKDCQLLGILIESAVKRGENIDDLLKYIDREDKSKVCEVSDVVDVTNLSQIAAKVAAKQDSFLIREFELMAARDQEFRDGYPYDYPEGYDKFIDSLNYCKLKRIVSLEGGKLPSYEKLGPDGYFNMGLMMVHLDIEMISELLPAIVKSIQLDEFYDGETILYQIDRNIIGGYDIYRYDAATGRLKSFKKNKMVHPELGSYQYYSTIEYYNAMEDRPIFYPIHKEVDQDIVDELYRVLQVVPATQDWRLRQFETVSDEEFVRVVFGM